MNGLHYCCLCRKYLWLFFMMGLTGTGIHVGSRHVRCQIRDDSLFRLIISSL